MKNPFRHVCIVGKPDGVGVAEPLAALLATLRAHGVKICLDTRTAGLATADELRDVEVRPLTSAFEGVELVIALGGDGTLLGIARAVADQNVPLVGVNLGTLGFLTDIPAGEMSAMFAALLASEYEIEERLLLHASVRRNDAIIHETVALNDVVVSRGAMGSMIEFAVEVNGEFVYSLRADGIIVATPTGSTAYALSCGGPILHPSLPAISLVPISPHTLSNRPVAIPSNAVVRIRLVRGHNARVNFDVQSFFDPATDDVVTVQAHANRLKLLHPIGYSYYAMLRSKLHWNERNS